MRLDEQGKLIIGNQDAGNVRPSNTLHYTRDISRFESVASYITDSFNNSGFLP